MSVELQHPHQTLQKREERLRSLVDHAAEAFFVGQPQGRIIDANRTACDELGYTRDELLALSAWDVVEEFTPAGFAALFKELAAGGPRTMTVSHRRKDGTRYAVEGRVCVVELQGQHVLFVLTRDITERQREAAALRESEDKFRKIFNHSTDGGFLLDQRRQRDRLAPLRAAVHALSLHPPAPRDRRGRASRADTAPAHRRAPPHRGSADAGS